jgi:DNA-binding MarR family transcriptional regulator
MIALRIVSHHPGLTLTELSRRMGLANSTVSGIVSRLERDGLLSRQPDRQDRRVFRVTATPQAEARREQFALAHRAALGEVLKLLPPAELAALRAGLAALARALDGETGREKTDGEK